MMRVRNDRRDAATGRLVSAFEARPAEFEATFVRIGRLACEEHFGVGRLTITAWLNQCGKDRLVELRADYVKRKEAERRADHRINRRDMSQILKEAFRERIPDRRRVSITLARHAAQHLRIRRNGGFIISPAPNGDWRVGTKLVSPAQLVDMATKRGFDPSLTGRE